MPLTIEGLPEAADGRFGIVVSRFNSAVTERLLEGALATLELYGVDEHKVTIAHCPGAFEVPLVARKMTESGDYKAVICLGAVIRGETPHFDFICAEATRGIGQAAQETGIPIIFGILTTDTADQAMARAGEGAGGAAAHADRGAGAERAHIKVASQPSNKGAEAALAALEMVSLLDQL